MQLCSGWGPPILCGRPPSSNRTAPLTARTALVVALFLGFGPPCPSGDLVSRISVNRLAGGLLVHPTGCVCDARSLVIQSLWASSWHSLRVGVRRTARVGHPMRLLEGGCRLAEQALWWRCVFSWHRLQTIVVICPCSFGSCGDLMAFDLTNVNSSISHRRKRSC